MTTSLYKQITSTPPYIITLTCGDQAENHKGMEMIGNLVEKGEGFQYEDLVAIRTQMELRGAHCELISLGSGSESGSGSGSGSGSEEAFFLRIRGGIEALLQESEYTEKQLTKEHIGLKYDKKAWMYGRIVSKHARWNLCFDEESREACYEEGKGSIVSWDDVPILKIVLRQLEDVIGKKAENLKVESNYYYDMKKCGIGFHGDSERRKVIGIRLGNTSMPLHYQWYFQGNAIGERIVIPLDPGDIYVMCEKAVGTDWKKKKIPTLRHAAGCSRFTV